MTDLLDLRLLLLHFPGAGDDQLARALLLLPHRLPHVLALLPRLRRALAALQRHRRLLAPRPRHGRGVNLKASGHGFIIVLQRIYHGGIYYQSIIGDVPLIQLSLRAQEF